MRNVPKLIVGLLLDAEKDKVVVEYHPCMIDSMPHTLWLIRMVGAQPTAFVAKGTAHSKEDAESQVAEKVRLLGVQVIQVSDNTSAK